MYIKVKVKANQKKEIIERLNEDTFRVSVKVKAEMNKANNRVIELISEVLSVPKTKLQLVTGHHSPNKILFIRDFKGN